MTAFRMGLDTARISSFFVFHEKSDFLGPEHLNKEGPATLRLRIRASLHGLGCFGLRRVWI